jgi:hypothetical protein
MPSLGPPNNSQETNPYSELAITTVHTSLPPFHFGFHALVFSHRSYDLSTPFAILRAALYLSLNSLHDEIQARIVQEMLHGLYHAFILFDEYERLTGGKWGTGGCRCRQYARREFHVSWSLLWPTIWKVDLDVPLLVFSAKAGFIKNFLRCL